MKSPLDILDSITDTALSLWADSFARRVAVLEGAGFSRDEAIQILIGIFGAAVKAMKPF